MPKARLYYCSGFPNYGGIQLVERYAEWLAQDEGEGA